MTELDKIQQQLPENMPGNFCVAPFLSTMQTTYGKTSPCAYGVTEWKFDHLSPKERWTADELNEFRLTFAQGQTPEPCKKCQNEELADKDSLRLRMLEWYPNAYQDFIKSGQWHSGPQHISTKVSNVCNLSCRTCGAWDSNSFADEGQYYIKTYNTTAFDTSTNQLVLHNKFVPRLPARHTKYSGFKEIDSNVTKLEFFGGEPLLNLTHLEFLEHLADTGKSKDITLFYSTNCTQKINPRHKKVWEKFKALEFSLSIDHIEDKYHYLRWPGNWNEVESNIKDIMELKHQLTCEVKHVMSPCCSLLNVYYIDEVLSWGQEHVGAVYINMIANPEWISVNCAPDDVKLSLLEHVQTPEVKGFINVKPHNPLFWKQFLIWTKRQDIYRKQDFTKVFPEYYNVIKSHWDSCTDLSEQNFYH
jgi:pyruvate-formate lyase-activating enzyme